MTIKLPSRPPDFFSCPCTGFKRICCFRVGTVNFFLLLPVVKIHSYLKLPNVTYSFLENTCFEITFSVPNYSSTMATKCKHLPFGKLDTLMPRHTNNYASTKLYNIDFLVDAF